MELGIRQRGAIDRREAVSRAHVRAPALIPRSVGRPASRLCPELDCLRGWLSADTIAAAERRAIAIGTGADRVLINAGLLDEDIYLRVLSNVLGIPFDPLDFMPRDACPLDDARLIEAPAAGVLPLVIGGEQKFVIAPQGIGARGLIDLLRANPAEVRRFRLTTSDHLRSFVLRHAQTAIGDRAARALATAWPELSAGPRRWRLSLAPVIAGTAIALAALIVSPAIVLFGCDLFLALIFLSWMALRVGGTFVARQKRRPPARLRDRELPVYSILAPLYREAASVEGLIAALRRIDYPPEKLDIKLIVEPDDSATREVLERLKLAPPFEVIIAPNAGPRTKPKALNAALPFARGAFTVIFDAEDRPEPGQLRDALAVFLRHGDELACVQASLTIDNTADNWLTAMFTADYAGQFDVFLPALTRFRMPLPLGGSSNHFRSGVLRAVGAWDPYNVTEDADLGLRLARFGYRSIAIEAATYEEAPAQLGLWLRQRTRWFKGWMQTWLVHMREPGKLRRELGPGAFLTSQLIVVGNVLASLVHPLLLIWMAGVLVAGRPIAPMSVTTFLFAATLVAGYLTSALLGAVGLFRRRLLNYAWVLLLLPVHWLLLSLAAWRALFQLLHDPYRWEKTEHGLARTSRGAAFLRRSLGY